MKTKSSRREFLKKTGALFAAPLAGCAFPSILSTRSPNSLLSHACVGTANMARNDMRELAKHAKLHITALCDVDATYLQAAAKLFPDARLYRNAFEMFAAEGARIDSVNVSTPDHTHFGYVREALRRKLNVYAQKPLCRTVAECREVERLAAEAGVVTQMGTQVAAMPCDRAAEAFLRNGVIGEVRHVSIFSNRGGQSCADHTWPLAATPVPDTLAWKTWLGPAPYRPFVANAYHPLTWRRWRDFGSSWLGDLGLHLLSPVWIGMGLGTSAPLSVTAETPKESAEIRRQYWPRNSHVTWRMPGVKASGGREFAIEWCDGNLVAKRALAKGDTSAFNAAKMRLADPRVKASMDPVYFPPESYEALFARTPIGEQPLEGRVVEGTEGWLLAPHYSKATPVVVLKSGKILTAPELPPVPSHWHEYVNACLAGGTTKSSFAWAGRLSEMVVLGNEAMIASNGGAA